MQINPVTRCKCTCCVHPNLVDENGKRLSLALSASRMGIWELAVATGEVVWSDECWDIVGRDSFDGTLSAFNALVHPDDVAHVAEALQRTLYGHEPYSSEFRWLHGDGTWRWLENHGQAEFAADGTPIRLFGTVKDVTAVRETIAELRDSELRFRQLAESIEEVFWLTNVEKTEILYISPGYETIWGRSRESIYASPRQWLEAIHTEDRVTIESAAEVQASHEYDHEYRIVRPNGEIRWIHDRAFPVRDEEGNVVRIAGVAEDITARRELEAQLRHTQKMQSIGELAGGIAHDFNNILTIISTAGDLLKRALPVDDENGRELLDEIRVAQQRATALTRQLLAFSRRDVVELRIVELDEAVIDTEKMLRRLLGEDILLTTALHSQGQHVRIDPGQLAQVLMNLAVNARDAMPMGGQLHIETGRSFFPPLGYTAPVPANGFLTVSLADSGEGMSQEAKSRAFEPFYTTKAVGEGTGMGLAVVHGIIAQCGGAISLESELGRGTTFTITLPAVDPTAPESEVAPETVGGNAETVLVVEDEESVRRMVESALTRQGYHVLAASSGRDALNLLAEYGSRVKLLMTDVVMPEMDGRELADAATLMLPGLKVLYTSGYTDDLILRRGIQQVDVAFLAKPYSIATLATRVRETLSA